VSKSAVEGMVLRKGESGAAFAARFMEREMKRAAPTPEIRQEITRSSGRDSRGVFARAGVRGLSDTGIWHRHEGGEWTVVPYPTRDTLPVDTWTLFEYGTPHTAARPFIRQALFSNTATVVRMMCSDQRAGGGSVGFGGL
jgi:hypothetical protein